MPPKFIKKYFWFNDFSKLDLKKDRVRIILNLLNFGDKKATDWLFDFYPKSSIKKAVINYGAKGELNDKSLHYWSLILNINERELTRSRF